MNKNTDISCPNCNKAELTGRFSCLDLYFFCPECNTKFDLADLAKIFDEKTFSKLEALIGHRHTNRI